MPWPFRRRIFVVLVVMTVVPATFAVAGWVVSLRRLLPAAGVRASTERVASTARLLLDGVDTVHLTVRERALLRHHLNEVSASVSLARRAETFLRYYTAGFAVVILLLGAAVLYAAVNFAGHLSRHRSRARARGRAAACIPRGGAPRRARDQESSHGHADRRGSTRTGGWADGQSGRHGNPGARGRDRSARTTGQRVFGIRTLARRTTERGRSRRAARRTWPYGRSRGRARLGPYQRRGRTAHAVRSLRTVATGVREFVPQRR